MLSILRSKPVEGRSIIQDWDTITFDVWASNTHKGVAWFITSTLKMCAVKSSLERLVRALWISPTHNGIEEGNVSTPSPTKPHEKVGCFRDHLESYTCVSWKMLIFTIYFKAPRLFNWNWLSYAKHWQNENCVFFRLSEHWGIGVLNITLKTKIEN